MSRSLSDTVCDDANTGVETITLLNLEAGKCMLVRHMDVAKYVSFFE
jgi:hypothetical protein